MRVIAGSAKGRRLVPVPGEGTRPIMDRVKESLFDLMGSSIVGVPVHDRIDETDKPGPATQPSQAP
ncbi:MAG: RsmD family RNA methyltransferase, partial [Anaerolineae bacterium]|nr:RsmD family RNA methyltransferase [Anaerolineae bacterium]